METQPMGRRKWKKRSGKQAGKEDIETIHIEI